MIKINGKETDKYVLDLSESGQDTYTFEVSSVSKAGRKTNWSVDTVNSNYVDTKYNGDGTFTATFDINSIEDDLTFYVRNTKNESAAIVVKPNMRASVDKEYVFTTTDPIIDEEHCNVFTFTVTSKETNNEPNSDEYVPSKWVVSYDGRPMSYDINPMLCVEDTMLVTVVMKGEIHGACTSYILLKQVNSGLTIKFTISNNNNTIDSVTATTSC